MDTDIIKRTAYISLLIQFITGIVGIHGITIPLKEKDKILTDIMILETIVQIIEFSFYIWLTFLLSKLSFDVTYTRYFDWFISTPIMLLTTIFFMKYLSSKTNKKTITKEEILNEDLESILKVLFSNLFMLLFGFLAEIKKISRFSGFVLGTIAFLYSFYTIYDNFVEDLLLNKILFWFMFTVWFFYGIAFLYPYVIKNISYNFLDIFSKNFYGLFIYFIILKTANYI